jgi:hypothetical protein
VRVKLDLLVLLLILLAVQAAILWRQQDLDTHFQVLNDSFHTPVRMVQRRTTPSPYAISAILIHGFRCSGSMMLPMARMLARNGIPTYVVDLPGHGLATSPLSLTCGPDCSYYHGNEYAQPILEALLHEQHLDPSRVVLIGHSWGGQLAMQSPLPVAGRISLEGPRPRISDMHNLCYVGGRDWTWTMDEATTAIEPGTSGGSPTVGNAYEFLIKDPFITHSQLVNSPTVNGRILHWIAYIFNLPEEPLDTTTDFYLYVGRTLLLATLLLRVLLLVAKPNLAEVQTSHRRLTIMVGIAGLAVGVLAIHEFGEAVETLRQLHFIGALQIVPFAIAGWFTVGRVRATKSEILWALGAFAILYLVLLAPVNAAFHQTWITVERYKTLLVYTVVLFPSCFTVRRLLGGAERYSRRLRSMAVFWALLITVLSLACHEASGLLISGFLVTELYCSALGILAGALLNSMLIAYGLAVVLPFF